MTTISITINGVKIDAIKGSTLLKASLKAGIYIPSICAHPDLPPLVGLKPAEEIFQGNSKFKSNDSQEHQGCQLCVVKIEGMEGLQTACSTISEKDMIISTYSPEIQTFRREKLMNVLSTHPHACLVCAQKEGCSREPCSTNVAVEERCCPELGRCELQKVAEYIGIREDTPRYKPQGRAIIENEPLFVRNYELCIGCTRCVRVCGDVRGVKALGFVYNNGETVVGSIAPTLKDSGCKFCGACVEVCPTGALTDKDILWAEREKLLVPCKNALIHCDSVFDDMKKFNPVFNERNVKSIKTEVVIMAIGQTPDLSLLGSDSNIDISPNGLIQTKKGTFETNLPGIFASGEVTRSPSSVVALGSKT